MLTELRPAAILLLLFLALTGLFYPFAMLELGHLLFPAKAEGSLIEAKGEVIGSLLIGQNFTGPRYFHPRPSAAGSGYDAGNSSGTNFGPSSPELAQALADRLSALKPEGNPTPVPVDLVTASGSGLDPDISPAAAAWQAVRVSAARNLDPAYVNRLIADATEPRSLGFLGERRVNVLRLNLMLDRLNGL